MAKTTAIVSVDSLILAAGRAGDTMLSKVREAAKLAASELESHLPLKERVAAVITSHADAFKTAGHNVKALFTDAITLLACGDSFVLVPNGKDAAGKPVERTVNASVAVDLPKHAMRDAAKQVRDQEGIGRAKASKPVAAKQSAESELTTVLAELSELLRHADKVDALARYFATQGYTLMATGTTAPAPVKTASRGSKPKMSMADLPSIMVHGAATA
jgi:hypothetical protein